MATMKRAILCGVLMLAGCGRPTFKDRAEELAYLEGLSRPTAEQTQRRDTLRVEREAAGRTPGDVVGRGQPPADEMTPDPVYTPRQEDRATLIAGVTPGFPRASLFDDFYESA